jgi:mono/diheme cytochrome c family protein
MGKRYFVPAVLMAGIAFLATTCTETPQRGSSERQRQIALGEKIFQEKECGKCHATTGKPTEFTLVANPETKPPDLSSVFLAMDTLFIKKHLQFTETTKMPPIPLTPHEITALTQYIATLHAQANKDPNLENPDGICPICGAPLAKSEAEANHLMVTYKNAKFHFECPDCKKVFERDPAWHSQSGYL